MKRAFLVVVFVLVLFGVSPANPRLAVDLPDPGWNISQTQVEVTTKETGSVEVMPGLALVSGDDFIVLDLVNFAPGKFRFRVRWAEASSWWSGWSEYGDFTHPSGPAGRVRVVP
jgi:hypothetical protein